MKILQPNETGRGILIEYDAGYVDPKMNSHFINEIKKGEDSAFNYENPIVYAVLQKHGIKNKNRRFYPKYILERENIKYQELIKIGASTGESDHPSEAVISIGNVAMKVNKTWWEGRTLMGELLLPITKGFINQGVISHPADKIASDFSHGILYGVSSRGVGSVKKLNGDFVVQDDFELICWDWVTSPSTIGAWAFQNLKGTEQYVEHDTKEPNYFDSKNTQNNNNGISDRVNSFLNRLKNR